MPARWTDKPTSTSLRRSAEAKPPEAGRQPTGIIGTARPAENSEGCRHEGARIMASWQEGFVSEDRASVPAPDPLAPDYGSDPDAARCADEANRELRTAGLSETAITAWWGFAENARRTAPYQLWQSGDFAGVDEIVQCTVHDLPRYRRALERFASEYFARQLASKPAILSRLSSTNP